MSSISQMERSSSQTRMLAMPPAFCRRSHQVRGNSRLQYWRCDDLGGTIAGGGPFCIEPPQPENESGSLPRLGAGPDLAFMRLHDLVDHRQAETGAAFKARLEGVENLFRLLQRHSCASVRKTDLPVVSQSFDAHLQSAAIAHGAHCVLGNVPED